ncbi:hypothetical protein BDF14DRAFT_1764859 [Spinellus fusiger]|nr:hypothetical protein BDF14DRAFT_1764859 [Spinellus fusiger]
MVASSNRGAEETFVDIFVLYYISCLRLFYLPNTLCMTFSLLCLALGATSYGRNISQLHSFVLCIPSPSCPLN